jgi:hypothetical protein
MQGRRKSAARIIREKTPLVLKERGAVASNCPRNDFQGVGDHFRCHFRNVSRKSGVLGEPFRPSDRVPQEKKTCALAGMAKRSVSSTPASMGRIFFRNASVGSPPQSLAGRCVDALAARRPGNREDYSTNSLFAALPGDLSPDQFKSTTVFITNALTGNRQSASRRFEA